MSNFRWQTCSHALQDLLPHCCCMCVCLPSGLKYKKIIDVFKFLNQLINQVISNITSMFCFQYITSVYLCIHVFLFPPTAAVNTDPSILGKYRAGFSECVGEVTRFLSTCEGVNTEVRTRLLSHLAACVTQISAVNLYGAHPGVLGHVQTNTQIPTSSAPQMPCKSGTAMHVSPEAVKLYGGFQVVPTPEGQFSFLVPSAALIPLSAQNSHHVSLAAPPLTSDSVWRPW